MSSNEPVNDVIAALNQAILTPNPEALQALITNNGLEKNLDPSLLEKAWQQYARFNHYDYDRKRKIQVVLILFDHCHYPEQQRLAWVQSIAEHELKNKDPWFTESILPHLHPVEETLPLATHLIQTRFARLSQNPCILLKLLRCVPQDRLQASCRLVMEHVQAMHGAQYDRNIKTLFQWAKGLDPLLKPLAFFFSNTPDPRLTSISDDWKTVFTRLRSKEQTLLPWILDHYASILITEHTLASLLATCKVEQRMRLLQLLFYKPFSCAKELCQNAGQLRNVLMLLPKSQRLQLLLLKNNFDELKVSIHVPDDLWPLVHSLLNPFDTIAILKQRLENHHDGDQPFANLVRTVPGEALWMIWQTVPKKRVHALLAASQYMEPLLNQLPTKVQPSVHAQCLTHLSERKDKLTSLGKWLQNERACATLLPTASRWLQEAPETQALPFDEGLTTLATRPEALHAFLDQLPPGEHNVLLPWLVSVTIQDIDVMNSLMARYTNKALLGFIVSGDWSLWTQKMPLIVTILERLTEKRRLQFIKILPDCSQPWKPENYQAVCRAFALFHTPVETFVNRLGLNRIIPLTPLMQAARDNNMDEAKQHIHTLNEQDWRGMTALMHAWKMGHTVMARYLAEQPGCDFSIRTLHDDSVFTFAITSDTVALRHLLSKSPCQPETRDALWALYVAVDTNNSKMLDFLFDAYFPGTTWQQTAWLPATARGRSASAASFLFPTCHKQATLPLALKKKPLSELDLNPFNAFEYQMQVLGINASKALNLDYLLPALTASGHVPINLGLTGFHISERELPAVFDLIKNNPQMKSLRLGTLDLHAEDKKQFIRDLNTLPNCLHIRLTTTDERDIAINLPVYSKNGSFFAHSSRWHAMTMPTSGSLRL